MKLWWITATARLAVEKSAVEALVGEGWLTLTRWYLSGFHLCADGVITAHGVEYLVRLTYPDQFPSVPPWVEPQDPKARWSNHQYGDGGALCLELRPDNWNPAATGADMLRSAYHLLDTENPLGDGKKERVASAHHIGGLQSYTWNGEPVLIAEGCLARLLAGQAQNLAAMRWRADDDVWPILVFDDVERARPEHPPSLDLGTLRIEIAVRIGTVLPTSNPATRTELFAATEANPAGLEPDANVLLIVVADGQAIPYHVWGEDNLFRRNWVLLPGDAGQRSGRRDGIDSKKVAIVGLGSVGCKQAESLLRSGIRRFVLVDGDIFLPGNIERHTLDWRDVGFYKASAVARRLKQIVPGVEVEVVRSNLNWQQSAKTQATTVSKIAGCDLIVDATGSVPTSLFLGAVAHENCKPFISTAVFEGGLGCIIGRSVPGRDPAFVDGRAGYVRFCEENGVAAPPSGNRTYEAIAEDGAPVVADDAAVSMAAAHGARVALDILEDTIVEGDAPWLLLGFKAGWRFGRHGETISLVVEAPTAVVTADDPDGKAFAEELIAGIANGTASAA